jgi:ATP-independent RNA helicase DbpA
MPNLEFSQLPIKSDILSALSLLGYERMTPIQEAALPPILAERDLIGQAKTGSGKTAAFAIGLLAKIDVTKHETQGLVLCPTRELSEQVCKEMRKIARLIPNVKITTLCGGNPMQAQEALLKHGVHCIVGTPGRVRDHIRKHNINLANIATLVLDEADRMLEMGFQDDITQIVANTPKSRQTLLFSATFPENIESMSNNFQKNAAMVKIDADPSSLNIEHILLEKTGYDNFALVSAILGHYRPESTLVFCNTKQKCQELASYLHHKGYHVQDLHGDLEQRERDEALVLFSNGSLSVLVATDVAARGLDIKDLSAVINFDMAHDADIHRHRVGRTGRAGRKGLAFSLVNSLEEKRLRSIEKVTCIKLDEKFFQPKEILTPKMATLRISCGRTNKLRAGDILGALTAHENLAGSDVGKIDICDTHSFVAIAIDKADLALRILNEGKIKGRSLKVARLNTRF